MIERKKLENYLFAIFLIGLILFIIWKVNFFGLLTKRAAIAEIEKNREIWLENAKENLKEDFYALESKNYFFVQGKLMSECTELDPNSHCPIRIASAKIDNDRLFISDSRFTLGAEADSSIYPYPLSRGINVLGFSDKNHNNIALEFEIWDSIPNKDLCSQPHKKPGLCTVIWTKEVPLNKKTLAESLMVKIKEFNYSFSNSNKTLNIYLKGEREDKKIPQATLAIYRNFKSNKFLINENNLELENKNGAYVFELDKSFNISAPEEIYSVLLLVIGENSFYGMEWIFEDGELVDSVVYD